MGGPRRATSPHGRTPTHSDEKLASETGDEPHPTDNSSDGEESMPESERSDPVHYPQAP